MGIVCIIEGRVKSCRDLISRLLYKMYADRKCGNKLTKFVSKDMELHLADKEGLKPYIICKIGKHNQVRYTRASCEAYVRNTLIPANFENYTSHNDVPPPPAGADSLSRHESIAADFRIEYAEEIAAEKLEKEAKRLKHIKDKEEVAAKESRRKLKKATDAAAAKATTSHSTSSSASSARSKQVVSNSAAVQDSDMRAAAAAATNEGSDEEEEEMFSGKPTSGSGLVDVLDGVSGDVASNYKSATKRASEKNYIDDGDADGSASADDGESDDERVKPPKRRKVSSKPSSAAAVNADVKPRKQRDSNLCPNYIGALACMSAAHRQSNVEELEVAMNELDRQTKLEEIVLTFSHDLVRHVTVLLVEHTVFEQKLTQFYMDQRYYLPIGEENELNLGIITAMETVTKAGLSQMNALSVKIKTKMDADAAQAVANASGATHETATSVIGAFEMQLNENKKSYEAFRRTMRDKFRNLCRSTGNKMVRHWNQLIAMDSLLPVRPPPRRALFESQYILQYGNYSADTTSRQVDELTAFDEAVGGGENQLPTNVCALLDILQRTRPIATQLGMTLLAKILVKLKSTESSMPTTIEAVNQLLSSAGPEIQSVASAGVVTIDHGVKSSATSGASSGKTNESYLDVICLLGDDDENTISEDIGIASVRPTDARFAEQVKSAVLWSKLQKLAGQIFADVLSYSDCLALSMHLRRETLNSKAVLHMMCYVLRAVSDGIDLDDLVRNFLSSEHAHTLECVFLVPFNVENRDNTGSTGYCFLQSAYQCKARAESGFQLSVADLIVRDKSLLEHGEVACAERVKFYRDLRSLQMQIHALNSSSSEHDMSDDAVRIDGTVYSFRTGFKEPLEECFWGKVDWIPLLGGNLSGFCHASSYPGLPGDKMWARFWNSTLIRRAHHIHTSGDVTTVAEIANLVSKPPNYMIFHINHFFIVDSLPVEAVQDSFHRVMCDIFRVVVKRVSCFEANLDPLIAITDAFLSNTETAEELMKTNDMFLKRCDVTLEMQHTREDMDAEQKLREERDQTEILYTADELDEASYVLTIAPLSNDQKTRKIKELQHTNDDLARQVCLSAVVIYSFFTVHYCYYRTKLWKRS